MPSADIVRSTPVQRTPRVLQLEGIFELPPTRESAVQWNVDLPLENASWNIGLIVGPSGGGKSTVARELFGDQLVTGFDWPAEQSVVDAFPESMSIRDITALLSSVGFSSPPAWLRPYRVLSNGEQFRVTIARALAESPELVVFDEFTSVVDRQVAQIGSAAVAKTVRRREQRFIAVTCHFDVEDWLQPDWVYQPHIDEFTWRSVQPRPTIELEIRRADRRAWKLFAHHHYLNREIATAAKCFIGMIDGEPVAFTAVLSQPHKTHSGWREHRTVCLPDYQGVGIGNRMSELVASVFRTTGKPYYSVTSNPAMIYHRARSPRWTLTRKPSRNPANKKKLSLNRAAAVNRLTAGFRYVGPAADPEAARRLLEG